MAEERRKKGRRAYLSDFQQTADGGYAYTGRLHPFQGSGKERKRALAVLWVLSAGVAAGAAVSGCVPAAMLQNCAYVLLPYGAGVLCAVSVVWLMCRLTYGGDPLRDYVYKATVEQFRARGILTAAFSAAALAGGIIFLALHGAKGTAGGSAAFLLCQGTVLACSIAWLRVTGRLRWES